MRVEHTTISKAKDLVEIKALRTRLTGNDIFEIKMLKYVDKWRKQFIEMYPHRVPLLLDPPNECGVRKFVCTTVRPTKLFYSELYNLEVLRRVRRDVSRVRTPREPDIVP